jgi:hypothetical protein
LTFLIFYPRISAKTVSQNRPKDGVRTGEGTFKFSDGRKFEGMYANNQPNGEGVLTFVNGTLGPILRSSISAQNFSEFFYPNFLDKITPQKQHL